MEIQDINLTELIERETGKKFTREGYIECPFHADKTPSLSVKFFANINKDHFKCWGCGEEGDAIDFIMKFKNINYKAAREYLKLGNEKTDREKRIDKIRSYIDWQLSKTKKGYKLLGIFEFVDQDNNPIYYKAKFLKPNGKKETPYYHLEGDKVINNRGPHEEVPYNLYNVLQAIDEGKSIVFVEGEKDANTINALLRGMDYVATSIKGCLDLSILQGKGFKSCVIPDTGIAGEKYKWWIYKEFNVICEESFKFIRLPGISDLGDNKDVTDWIEYGHSKEDLLKAFNRSLDIKNIDEFQQDHRGIYKQWIDKDSKTKSFPIADFNILDAKRVIYEDDSEEGVYLKLKSCTGEIVERMDKATVFNDMKSFKNFLGTIDLSFLGKPEDITKLARWINKYWAVENEHVYKGVKFLAAGGQLNFVTSECAFNCEKVNTHIKADGTNLILPEETITKEELKLLKSKIFRFAATDKSIPIVGTTIHNLLVYQAENSKIKMHHLLIVGESGSGKSTILSNVIAAILNYPKTDIKSIGMISIPALTIELSKGNYSALFDEFKPSSLGLNKVKGLSETLRNLYDRQSIAKGSRSLENKYFRLERPLIMAGEEGYPNQERALMERSSVVYLSRRERTEENTECMKWIVDNEKVLNKFGKALIEIILNISVDKYKEIRIGLEGKFKKLNNRLLDTAVNIATGIEVFNLLLKKYGLVQINGYERFIEQNICDEILEGATETRSTVEQMIILYNEMIEDGRALDVNEVIQNRGDGLFIRTSEMINQICVFCNTVGSAEVTPLKLRDFKKQATKSGYLLSTNSKFIKVNNKSSRFDEYSKDRMRTLHVDSIVEQEVTPVEGNVIAGVFNSKG